MIARAKVTVTLEIEVPDTWSSGCNLDQVYRQAKEAAVGRLRQIEADGRNRIKVLAEPNVTTIIVQEDKP